MKRQVLWVVGAALSSVGATAYADCAGTACTGVVIETLAASVAGPVAVTTSGNEAALTGCALVNGGQLSLDVTQAGSARVYAALLAAKTSDTPVTLTLVNDGGQCSIVSVTLTN